MKGLDLHRGFFEECGKPLLLNAFPDEFPQIAVASVGCGSDRLGADDEYSRDHCWGPGFMLFSDRLSLEALKEIESYLFEHLPWEYRGFTRPDCPGSANGVRAWTVDQFFSMFTGFASPPERDRQWLLIADEALYHVTNGEVFYDPSGDLTRRRTAFGYYPDDVWRFKLAGRAMRVDIQRYSMERCLSHGENVTARLILGDGLYELFHFLCLVNRRYAPNDRWLYWVVRRLPVLADDIAPVVAGMMDTTDVHRQLLLFQQIVSCCADYCYEAGLASKGQCWWADLRQAITGDLRDFPVPSWIGVEFRYASQFALDGDFRTLLADG